MKAKRIVGSLMLVLPLFCVSSIFGADGFESVRCGGDVRKAMVGRKTSNERVVVIEARHKDLQLKDLGAEEISDGEEYAVLEDGDVVRDVLKFPKHSKDSPQFEGSCQLNGHDVEGVVIGVLKNEEGAAMLPAAKVWKIDEKQKKFVMLQTEGLRCSRDGINTADGGR
jgi:hypothetical protein